MSTTTEAAQTQPATPQPPSRTRRRLLGAGVLVLVLVAAGIVWALNRGPSGVPYTDPRAAGALTLCNANGHPITSGSVKAAPFVARAVGVTPAAEAKSGATLFAYQPREGLGAGEWSGQQLTASTSFTQAANPIGQATVKDTSLADYLAAYPARWDGLVQLRLYVESPTFGIAGKYDTVDLRVDGDDWKVVGKAGTASCTAGDATSSETTSLNYAPATH